jgi:MYXO-CTERM domain-containing protein
MVKLWLAAVLIVSGASTGALAQWTPGPQGAPGPVIGAGLPALLLIGGVWVVRRIRRRKQ